MGLAGTCCVPSVGAPLCGADARPASIVGRAEVVHDVMGTHAQAEILQLRMRRARAEVKDFQCMKSAVLL